MLKLKNSAFTIVELLIVIVVIGVLAAITIVSYNGIVKLANEAALRADVLNASDAISLEQISGGDYPATLDSIKGLHLNSRNTFIYKYDNTASPKTFCLMGRFNSSIFSASESSGVTKAACLTNLLENSDFSNGFTDWVSVAASSVTVNNNIATITADGSLYYSEIRQFINATVTDHKYYIRSKMRVTNNSADTINGYIDAGGNKYAVTKYNPVANTWYETGGVITSGPNIITSVKFGQVYADGATANGKVMEVQNTVAIDLTEIFGAGNEPTGAQVDSIISQFPNNWFTGTKLTNL